MPGMGTRTSEEEFGARLRQALAEAGLSQNEFEKRVGLSRGYASRLIRGQRGQRLDMVIAHRMVEVLRCDHDWLFLGLTPAPNRQNAAPSWPGLETAIANGRYAPPDIASVRALYEGQDDVAPLTWARRLDDARRRREQGLDEAEAERARLERLSRAETPLDEVLRARPELQSVAARFDPHGPRPVVGWLEFLLEEARRETKGKRRR